MRIVGGAFRGRRLAALGGGDPGAHLRPTADRVRESLFNVLASRPGAPLDGARVLDLFAGTGALGLEALSRGAAEATFVETGRKALALLAENIALTGTAERSTVLRCDATRLPPAPAPCGLVFLDPPYGKGLGVRALDSARRQGWIAPDALILWEEAAAQAAPAGFAVVDLRRYGAAQVTFLTPDGTG